MMPKLIPLFRLSTLTFPPDLMKNLFHMTSNFRNSMAPDEYNKDCLLVQNCPLNGAKVCEILECRQIIINELSMNS
jgi:hypothetical protein